MENLVSDRRSTALTLLSLGDPNGGVLPPLLQVIFGEKWMVNNGKGTHSVELQMSFFERMEPMNVFLGGWVFGFL